MAKQTSQKDAVAVVRETIHARMLATSETPVVLMVSGGSDSTALAYIGSELAKQGAIGPVAMLHVNHGIRGDASDGDQAFVEKLAALLEIPLTTRFIDVPALAATESENIEAVARRERYRAANELLESLCYQASMPLSAGRIFTAHTQDDRVENFYMRSIVGTGPGGFRSMRYLNGNVARPCLDLSRQDLRNYLFARKEAGLPTLADDNANVLLANERHAEAPAQSRAYSSGNADTEGSRLNCNGEHTQTLALWREDATNAHTDLFRGYVRHEIVPLAKARNGRLLDTLTRTMNLIADEDDFMDLLARKTIEREVTQGQDEARLFSPEFGQEALPIQRRAAMIVLQGMLGVESRIETASIEKLLGAWSNGKPISGYKANIQGNLAISANKRGVRLEPMEAYRARRKRK